MAKQNQHIDEYLNAYRAMKDIDFAVMITGPWGCGKTYFIKQYLDEHCASNGKKQHLYISLNGVAHTDDIDMALFQAAHPVLGSNLAVTAGKIFMATLKVGLKIDMDINKDGNTDGDVAVDPMAALSLPKFILSTKGKLLVFDDLERCLLKPEEVLGYLNAFVEHGDEKVLIIGEEDHLNKNSNERYRIIKEKVIGKTFRLTERIEEIFDDLISSEIYPGTHVIIRRNNSHIVKLFQTVDKETKKHNYRALKHALRDFEYFYPKIDSRFRENAEFVNDLFRVFITLDYELQIGNLSPDEFSPTDPIAVELKKKLTEKDAKADAEPNSDKILKRHGFQYSPLYPSSSNLIFLPELWGKILRNEQVDLDLVSDSVKNSSYFPSQQPEWVVLWHWRRIDDADAEKALKEVRSKLGTLEYRSREVILHVFSILLGLSELNAIPETKDELLKKALDYLETLVSKKYLTVPERDSGFYWAHSGSFGLGYWGEGSDEFKKLVNLIDEAVEKAVETDKQASVPTWLTILRGSPEEFLDSISSTGKYYRDPILKYFQPAEFVDAILGIPNEKSWLISKILEKRYEMYGKDLTEEIPLCEGVVQELGKRLAAHKGCVTPTVANLKYLKKQLEEMILLIRHEAKLQAE